MIGLTCDWSNLVLSSRKMPCTISARIPPILSIVDSVASQTVRSIGSGLVVLLLTAATNAGPLSSRIRLLICLFSFSGAGLCGRLGNLSFGRPWLLLQTSVGSLTCLASFLHSLTFLQMVHAFCPGSLHFAWRLGQWC